ncbi:MAG: N-6 DNA methylase [Thermofilaceae archaeon]
MSLKPTENTVTGLLAKELERRGVQVAVFPSLSTPRGVRYPDLLCEGDRRRYVIEAKFREQDLLKAVSKIYDDYLKHADQLGIKGGFAILYPEELAKPIPVRDLEQLARRSRFKLVAMFPRSDPRNTLFHEGTLDQISDILARLILSPPERVEPSLEWIIRVLREATELLAAQLRNLSGKSLEAFFGGRDVFENILQYEEREYPVESMRQAAAYLLVSQLLFYHVLSNRVPERFPEIDEERLRRPSDLGSYFGKVLDVNYKAVFSYDVTSLIPPSSIDLVRAIVSAVKGLAPEKVGSDLLGTVFHDLVPLDVRKAVAAYYTNPLAAELLAWLSIDRHDCRVADFAVGSGGLLVAAYRRKRYLLEMERAFTGEDHRRFVGEELLGVDVMPFAASIAACHLALQSPEHIAERVAIAVWDSTELEPGKTIPSIAGLGEVLKGQPFIDVLLFGEEDGVKGVVSLTGERPEEIRLGWYDVVIMNPPFTRQERIPEDYKKRLLDRFPEYRQYISGRMGLHGYFILLADRFLKDGGRMALVLPATVLRVSSMEGVRRLLAEKYHVEYIVTTWHRSAFSESARFREVLLVARKGEAAPGAKTVVAVLKELPRTPEEARGMAEAIRSSTTGWEDERLAVRVYEYSMLRGNPSDWYWCVAFADPDLMDALDALMRSPRLVKLSKLAKALRVDLDDLSFGSFHGFVLFDRSRALKRRDQWIAKSVEGGVLVARHTVSGTEVKIPLGSLGRGLRRLSYVRTLDVTETADYLILSWFDGIERMVKLTLRGSDIGLLTVAVDEWKRTFVEKGANLLVTRRFNISAPGTSLLAFYSDRPIVGVNMWSIRELAPEHAKIVALWLNSTFGLLQILALRAEAEGAWITIHDYILSELKVPDPGSLGAENRQRLLALSEKYGRVRLPSILEQLKTRHPFRREVDEAFLQALKLEGINLEKLYESLTREIETLKRIMRGAEAEESAL